MAGHPVPGIMYLTPTAAASGGTRVYGVQGDRFEFDDGTDVALFGSGLEADAWTAVRKPPTRPATLRFIPGDIASATLQMLFSLLSTGSAIDSHGGNSTAPAATAPSVALVIRPRDTTQLYLYGPRWSASQDTRRRIVWDRTAWRFDGSELVLFPRRSLDGSKKAFMHNTAANINTHYGLTEA